MGWIGSMTVLKRKVCQNFGRRSKVFTENAQPDIHFEIKSGTTVMEAQR
jgi:hypothetical protein